MRARTLALAALGFSLAALLASGTPASAQVSDAEVAAELAKLGDPESVVVRDDAEVKLTQWATGGVLTAEQLRMIKAARSDPDHDRSGRSKRVYASWALTRPVVVGLLSSLRVEVLRVWNGRVQFRLGGGTTGSAPPDSPVLKELLNRYQALRNAVLAGETQPGSGMGPDRITSAANALADYVNGLTQEQFDSLQLKDPIGNPKTKQQILDAIDAAIMNIPAVKNELNLLSGGIDPNPASKVHVPAGTGVQPDVGSSLSLSIASVLVPGELDGFRIPDPQSLSRPPAGYAFVGSIYDFLADGALAVSGPIEISIEYGAVQLIGNPVQDPALLQLARLANGNFEILPASSHDLVNHVFTASYLPEPIGSGLDAFGEFALVQPAPESLPALGPRALVALGLALAAAARWAPRAPRPPHANSDVGLD